jgi:RND family efflux transporter MFP subunit
MQEFIYQEKKMKKVFILFMILLPLVWYCGGCGGSDSAEGVKEEKIPVEITPVKLGEITQSLQYSGDIIAEYEVNVFSKIPDRIERFFVDEGDTVKKGSVIAKILATTIEQAVRQTEAGLVAARAQEANLRLEYERAQRLYQENAMSQQQYEAIKTQFEATQAQVEQAQAALASIKSQKADATLTAPISGIIGKRYYETGDMAYPSTPVVKIVRMERVKIVFDATEEDLGKLDVGQKAMITVKAYPDRRFEGKVLKISPILDPQTRMAEVEILVENKDGVLKPGMYAEVEVITGIIENIIVVPRYASIENTTLQKVKGEDQVVKNYYVFVVDSNRAVQKKLDILYINHRWLAVKSGINIGDQLVIAGQNNLREGLPVAVNIKEDKGL